MNYAIKTPAGALYKVVLNGELPPGKTIAELDLLPVQTAIPEGYRQDFTQGPVTARGWQIVDGIVLPFTETIPPPPPLSDEEIYTAQLALGYLDPVTSIKLKTTESAQTKFTSQVTLLQLAMSANAAPAQVEFWDFNDAAQSLPLSDFLGLMLRYGAHCAQLFKDYAP